MKTIDADIARVKEALNLIEKELSAPLSIYCTISEFPGTDFHPDGDDPHQKIYSSPSVQACVASELVEYFVDSTFSNQAISRRLWSS